MRIQKRRALVYFTVIACLLMTACTHKSPPLLMATPSPLASAGAGSTELPQTVETSTPQAATNAEEALSAYIAAINARQYEAMYGLIHAASGISQEDFIARNKKIYEGIDAKNVAAAVTTKNADASLNVQISMDTQAGKITFATTYRFAAYGGATKLEWSSSVIFPALGDDDKVRMTTPKGERGSIFDRNGQLLAGKDKVYSAGFVPGKMDPATRDADIAAVAQLLDMTVEQINGKLSESWVKDELFVPLKNISYSDTAKKEALLLIKGIGLNTVKDRVYPLGQKAAHLTGYIANINAEQLAARTGLGYTAGSKIGKVGMEALLEDRIRGIDGCKIAIVDKDGKEKQTLAEKKASNGEDVTLTIDAALQAKLYDRMQNDKGAAVVLNPKTGEVLALVSTPSYDPNDFILGLTEARWAQYNDEALRPMVNRFKASYAPGSSLKPITAAIGLSRGAFGAQENFGASGRSWQKDTSWGTYKVTTLQQYGSAATMQNALIYSDNIYYAKAALKIGAEGFAEGLKSVGFGQEVPFDFGLSKSTFGKELAFTGEVDLADSGYGQGKVLVNPVHMAAIYTAFVNHGNMIAPRLEKAADTQTWKEGAFADEVAQTVRTAMVQVVENPNGTGHSAKVKGLTIAGKTGTAEIKSSKADTAGTELGWFVAYTADENAEKPLLALAVVEDVKGRGGSHYVIPIVRSVFAD